MSEIIVGVADLQIANTSDAVLSTYALGSCVGITLYDPVRHCGGMLHAMLPDSRIHGKSTERRSMFVDTGMADLFKKLRSLGADPRRCECKIFGGAQVLQADNYFKIGQKNIHAFQDIAAVEGLLLKATEVGGQHNRTIKLFLENGQVSVKTPNQEIFWR